MDQNLIPDLSIFHHSTTLQLRFNDCDVLGHVNNTVYYSFYDTGKAKYFEAVKGEKIDWQHVDTVIANSNCNFIAPTYFEEEIEVLTTCLGIANKSFRLLQVIREAHTGQVKSVCESVMVCFDLDTRQTCAVSESWRAALQRFEGRSL